MTEARRSGLAFRNLDVSPDQSVRDWPFEGILTALERGSLADWRRIAAEVAADPWGPTARKVEEVVASAHPFGTGELMQAVVASARSRVELAERAEVARRVRSLAEASGLSRAEFAERIGTSASRLSTYASGKVTPSAALLVRMETLAGGQKHRPVGGVGHGHS